MVNFLLALQIISAVLLICLILLQKGESGLGGLGGGGSGNMGLFSVKTSGNLLTKMTMIVAGAFMVISLSLVIATKHATVGRSSVLDQPPAQVQRQATDAAKEAAAGAENAAKGAAKGAEEAAKGAAGAASKAAEGAGKAAKGATK